MASRLKLVGSMISMSHGLYFTVKNAVANYPQIIWTICASFSLLSSRHLLVESNIHYPLLLYVNQITTAVIITPLLHPWQQKIQGSIALAQSRKCATRAALVVTPTACLMALSMICSLQAILHFHNLPILVMLTAIAFFAESLLLLVTGVTPYSHTEILRISLLALACAGILIDEYRLSVPALVASIPAMLLAGITRALGKTVAKYYPGNTINCAEERQRFVGISSLVATAWVLLFWPGQEVVIFDLKSIPLLISNALSTAVALIIGKSIFFPFIGDISSEAPKKFDHRAHRNRDTISFMAMTGLTGCYTTLLLHRSYMSMYQLVSFGLAIACIGGKAVYDAFCRWIERRRDHREGYALSTRSYSEAAPFIEESDINQEVPRQKHFQGAVLPFLLVSIALLGLWIAYPVLNFTERRYKQFDAALDMEYRPRLHTEIVISMYKEPVSKVMQLTSNLKSISALSEAQYTLYIKDSEVDSARIKQQTGVSTVVILPNIGREGETYLNHVLNRWDSLAKHTIFLQADVHNPREFYTRLREYFNPAQTGYLSLSWSGGMCSCENCSDRFFWRDSAALFPSIHYQIYNSTACDNILLSYKGQFAVSAARIRGISKTIYQDLWQAFVDKDSWAHQKEYLQGRPDSMSAPDFGYTIERIWNLLFQCSNMSIAWKCPTLLSGRRTGGSIEDCQCFDPATRES